VAATPDSEDRNVLAILVAAVFILFILAGIVGVIFMNLLSAWRRLNQLRRGSVRVGPAQRPDIYAQAQAVRTALEVTTPVAVYVVEQSRAQTKAEVGSRRCTNSTFLLRMRALFSAIVTRLDWAMALCPMRCSWGSSVAPCRLWAGLD
jgi:hypothetical protein